MHYMIYGTPTKGVSSYNKIGVSWGWADQPCQRGRDPTAARRRPQTFAEGGLCRTEHLASGGRSAWPVRLATQALNGRRRYACPLALAPPPLKGGQVAEEHASGEAETEPYGASL